jgi:hypothetical protein
MSAWLASSLLSAEWSAVIKPEQAHYDERLSRLMALDRADLAPGPSRARGRVGGLERFSSLCRLMNVEDAIQRCEEANGGFGGGPEVGDYDLGEGLPGRGDLDRSVDEPP